MTGAAWSPRAARSSTCTGPPAPPGYCPAFCRAARPGRCSWPTGAPLPPAAAPLRPPTSARSPAGAASYPHAEYLFKTASAALDPHPAGWTLHQLWHSALTHLAAAGRSAAELQAKSRHAHLGSLGHYVRLGEETSARITAEHDPAARRRPR
ncbi:hypothetical protein ABZ801_33365 [Actinomadura sp. NPDC047616]|uniref:hypothetical protein n=1 Tax=Actinomadura sp. NPDC047616 TaxID=3155914 RepID=UPI0033E081FF